MYIYIYIYIYICVYPRLAHVRAAVSITVGVGGGMAFLSDIASLSCVQQCPTPWAVTKKNENKKSRTENCN